MINKTNGATFMVIEELVNKILPGQFWPCLSFSALRPLYCCDMNLCGDGVVR